MKFKKVSIVVFFLVIFALGGWWWVENKREARLLVEQRKQKELLRQRKEKALKSYREYMSYKISRGLKPDEIPPKQVKKLKKAVELQPKYNDYRQELFMLYKSRAKDNPEVRKKMKELLGEGLKVKMKPEKKQYIMRLAAYNFPELLGTRERNRALEKAAETAPHTDWARDFRRSEQ